MTHPNERKCGGQYEAYPNDCESGCRRFAKDCDGPGDNPFMSDQLKELRDQWEKDLEILLEIPIDDTSFIVILVNHVCHRSTIKEYHFHRYFKLREDWVISVDGRSVNKGDMIDIMIKMCKKDWKVPE